jgi:predicted  nucleic acid-binding Zn-ribbon protein
LVQKPKPPAGVSRAEFDDLAALVSRNQSRIEALEKNDHDLEERMNRSLAETNVKIDALGASQQQVSQKIDAFMRTQGEANQKFQQAHDELRKSNEKVEGVLDRIADFMESMTHAFRLDEEEGLGEFREDQFFLRKLRRILNAGGGFALNAVIGGLVVGAGAILVAGVASYVKTLAAR